MIIRCYCFEGEPDGEHLRGIVEATVPSESFFTPGQRPTVEQIALAMSWLEFERTQSNAA